MSGKKIKLRGQNWGHSIILYYTVINKKYLLLQNKKLTNDTLLWNRGSNTQILI